MTKKTICIDSSVIDDMLPKALAAISGAQTTRDTAERLHELRKADRPAFASLFRWLEYVMPLIEIKRRTKDGWTHFESLYAGHVWLKSKHLTEEELRLLVGLADVDELEAVGGAQ